MPSSGHVRISRANPGPDALKPLVVDHTQLVRQTEMMNWIHLFDGIKASDGSDALKPLVVDHTQLVRQRHQGIGWIWCLKTIGFDAPLVSTKKMRPSANETNRLDINHWFFGRRNLTNLTCQSGTWCLKTIGCWSYPARETNGDDELNPFVWWHQGIGWIWCLKTIGCWSYPARETKASRHRMDLMP